MLTIKNTILENLYELLTQVHLNVDNDKPTTICFLCCARLKRCSGLRQQAIKSNEVLEQLFRGGLSLATSSAEIEKYARNSLQVTPTNHVQLESVVCEEATLETKIDRLESYKEEKETEEYGHDPIVFADDAEDFATDGVQGHTDSEDDLPLIAIGSKKTFTFEPTPVERKRRKNKAESDLVVDAEEIELTPEEQKRELLERASSENYINSPYKCDKCYKGFVHPQAFRNHMAKHDQASGAHECAICALRYSSARQLRAHEASAHARRFACARCPHRAHTRHQAKDHEKWHNGHTYPCQICGQKFQKPTSYLTHLRKHHSEQPCARCGESFVGRHGLLMHRSKAHRKPDIDIPADEASESFCAECNVQFLSRDAWKRHQLTSFKHTSRNESSSECTICGEQVTALSRAAHLRAHLRELRPPPGAQDAPTPTPTLPCPQCDGQFVTRSRLQAHVKRVHLGLKYDRNVVCELCGKKCTSAAALRYHQRRHTGERPFACNACHKRFAERGLLRVHARTHSGERPYACHACHKRFAQKPALNRHYRVHSGARPYSCAQCSKCFSQSNSLKVHIRSVHLKLPHPRRQKGEEKE
ncbi:unnamed protein product, partial [Iphiclides podalirius]